MTHLLNSGLVGGAPLSDWIYFHLGVFALVLMDLFVMAKVKPANRQKAAWAWTVLLACLACGFAFWVSSWQGRPMGLAFISGYLVETSLSIDNLFVFLVMFRTLGMEEKDQHRALLWGVGGAILMRALFISLGVELLERFSWMEYVFGVFLMYAAWRLVTEKKDGEEGSGGVMKWLGLTGGSSPAAGKKFLLVIVAIELTDLVFALDSIPAVLGITHEPFVVYTSNIFAVLGLRSLYFALAGMLDKFRFLHYGLGAILAFVAFKMLAIRWVEVPIPASLGVIAFIVGLCIALSLAFPAEAEESKA